MRAIIIIFSIFLFGGIPVKITNLKLNYRQSETINYTITSQSKYNTVVFLSLEGEINGKWKEVIHNIGSSCKECTEIYLIDEKHPQTLKYDLRNLDKSLFQNNKLKIRIKVYYTKDYEKGFEKYFYSNPFLVSR